MVDLVFLVDTSGSIRDKSPPNTDNFEIMLRFVNDIVQLFHIGVQKTLVGMIGFSNDAYLHFNIMEHTDIRSLSHAIIDLPYAGGTTNTAAALELLLNSAQDGTMRFRPGVPRVAILLTDGVSSDRQGETVPFAERVREVFQFLFVVGITNEVDRTELKAIAGDPSRVFYSPSFDFFDQLLEALTRTLCDSELNLIYSNCCFKFTIYIYTNITFKFYVCLYYICMYLYPQIPIQRR